VIARTDIDALGDQAGSEGRLRRRAESELAAATTLDDLRAVSATVSSARRARLGPSTPTRDCLFDPRHAPATRMVRFAPSGGDLEPVPACEDCCEAIAAGRAPALLMVGEQAYWHDPLYAAYYRHDMRPLKTILADQRRAARGKRESGEPIGIFDWVDDLVELISIRRGW
jgi:hypothetical protein